MQTHPERTDTLPVLHGIARERVRSNTSFSTEEMLQSLPRLSGMGEQLKQVVAHIEEAVLGVCSSFQVIADRARENTVQASHFLSSNKNQINREASFEELIHTCDRTLTHLMSASTASGAMTANAVEQIHKMDVTAREIGVSMQKLEDIATGNKILALNAHIEASRSGAYGAGFAAVAVELGSQTDHSRQVTAHVSELSSNLRALAESAFRELNAMRQKEVQRVQECSLEAQKTLDALRATHDQMQAMMSSMTEEGVLLSKDISSAVRGLQFQDRVSQRISHVVHDLQVLQGRLSAGLGLEAVMDSTFMADNSFSQCHMQEEREVYGLAGLESSAGEIELF